MTSLRVIAAAVLGSRGLLLVSKREAPDVYYLPGGKPEPGEAPLDCLRRELAEELGVGIAATEPFGEVRAPAALEGVEMRMTVFRTAWPAPPHRRPRSRRSAGGRTSRPSAWPRRSATA